MPILVTCECGKKLKAPDSLAGKHGKCPGCGNALLISAPEVLLPPEAGPILVGRDSVPAQAPQNSEEPLRLKNVPPPEDDLALSSSHAPSAPATDEVAQPGQPYMPRAEVKPALPFDQQGSLPFWRFRYAFFAFALLPLVLSTFSRKDDVLERFKQTLAEAPDDVKQKIAALDKDRNADEDTLFAILPEHKLQGALLSRTSKAHWIYALVSSAIFLVLIRFLFPHGNTELFDLIKVGLFTGTIGIIMLIAVQYIAEWSQYIGIRGGGKIMILILIAKFIGFSYNAALDPSNGFVLSFIGFTCGVGLCEEICKAFPIIKHFTNKAKLNASGALAWGLASGVGFGVSEGIHYAGMYNGVSGGDIYIIRFASCVCLHAIWCGAIGVALHRNQLSFQGGQSTGEMALPVLYIISVPMILHGLYDTLLKRHMPGWAVIVALVSFVWLVYQIERARSEHGPSTTDAVPMPNYA